MAIIPEPQPVSDGTFNEEFHYNEQLSRLFAAMRALSLTQTGQRAIEDGDKAGNLDGYYIVQTSSGTADADNTWTHRLRRIPRGYIVVKQDKAASVYNGSVDWTTSTITLKVSVATVALTILVF